MPVNTTVLKHMGPAAEKAIDVVDLSIRLGGTTVIDSGGLQVGRGEVVGLVGPNGSGKTTLLRFLAGLIIPSSGAGNVFGADIQNMRDWPRVGLLLEAPPFIDRMSGIENLGILGDLSGRRSDFDYEQAMLAVGLAPGNRTPVGRYSAGMRKRLGIAQAIMDDLDLVLLDEPTNGLDPEGVVMLRGIVRACAKKGETVVFSSHMLGEVAELCDDVYLVHGGGLTRLASGNGGAALEREYLSRVGAKV